MMTDPIADMLARIRNANKAMHEHVAMPSSRQKVEIATLTARVDSLVTETKTLGERAYKAFYVIGKSSDLR